ncbi:MAG: DUF488 domain-containing protein [Nitrospinae bacterium]|nr:DUF488 domain-containing protein [Nitrospinota bacterium]
MIYSIGHSTMETPELLAILEGYRIAKLIDVRSHPRSRYAPQFNKGSLSLSLKRAGIEYIWEGKYLGGLDSTSINSPEFIFAMDGVLKHSKRSTVAIMCSEKNPAQCHRANKLSAWIHRNTDIEVFHIVRGDLISGRQFEMDKGLAWLWPEFRGEKHEGGNLISQAELFD